MEEENTISSMTRVGLVPVDKGSQVTAVARMGDSGRSQDDGPAQTD